MVNANASVSGPTLPIYIDRIMINFPSAEREAVMPVDNPTVAKAEISSNKSARIFLSLSVIERKKVHIKINSAENIIIAKALFNSSNGIVLPLK